MKVALKALTHIIIWKRISALALILFPFTIQAQINCENDETGLIPIVDLLTGVYDVYQGGLYPGGTNTMPLAHADSGVAIAQSIKPINFDGEIDTVYGKTVVLALGSGTAGKAFNKFISSYQNAGYGDSCLRFINACTDMYSLSDMYGPDADDNYWKTVNDYFQAANLKKKQVAAVWLMTPSVADTFTTTTAYVDSLKNVYIEVVKKMKKQLPNVKLLYISGLYYGGYTNPFAQNAHAMSEPAPYLTDFAIKGAIQAQIDGDTSLIYSGEDADAPWMCWGPNYWADGRNLRTYDDLRWLCPGDFDMAENGYYLDGSGTDKLSSRLYDFLTTDPTTTPWIFGLPYPCYTEVDTSEGEVVDTSVIPENEVLWITQNPVKGIVKFTLNLESDGKAQVYIFDLLGNQITEGAFYKIEPGKVFSIRMLEEARGIYVLSVALDNKVYNKTFYLDN